MSSRRQNLLARVNWYLQSSLKHVIELTTDIKSYYRGGRYRQVSLYNTPEIWTWYVIGKWNGVEQIDPLPPLRCVKVRSPNTIHGLGSWALLRQRVLQKLLSGECTGHLWWQFDIGSGNGLMSSDNKPLSELICTFIFFIDFWQSIQRLSIAY